MPGTILKFEEGELLEPGVDINSDDNPKRHFLGEGGAPGGTVLVNNERTEIGELLAITFPTYFDDHTIVEADMVFNGVNHRWFTDHSNTFSKDNFVEAVALHEFGHFIGLQHSPLPRRNASFENVLEWSVVVSPLNTIIAVVKISRKRDSQPPPRFPCVR